MELNVDNDICKWFGLQHEKQLPEHKILIDRLMWSCDNGRTAFGSGSVTDKDVEHIFKRVTELFHLTGEIKIFSGWSKKFPNSLEVVRPAFVRISAPSGITYPYSETGNMRLFVASRL